MSADNSGSQVHVTAAAALFRTFRKARRKIPGRVLHLLDVVAVWGARSRQRRRLHGLSDHMLKDIGISRADVEHETGKPFWRR